MRDANRENTDHTDVLSNGVGQQSKPGSKESELASSGIPVERDGLLINGNAEKTQSSFYGHSREEITRLMLQGLEDLGYPEAARSLALESGLKVEDASIRRFRQAILDGCWEEAESLLFGPAKIDRKAMPNGNQEAKFKNSGRRTGGFPLVAHANIRSMKFLIREEKYRHLLELGKRVEALVVLQTELQPLKTSLERLHTLSGLLISSSKLASQATTDVRRQELLKQLSCSISPSLVIPAHRLATLLRQACQSQIARCTHHNPPRSQTTSLFADHRCDPDTFPLFLSCTRVPFSGEVWFVDFSHNGKYLAVCGKSTNVVIYATIDFEVVHRLRGHGDNVVYVAWSPDDSKVITCCQDSKARIFDVVSGSCTQMIDHHDNAVSSAAWTPDGEQMVTGSLSKTSQLCLRSTSSSEPFIWDIAYRVQHCSITPDGKYLIVMSTGRTIAVYDLASKHEKYHIEGYARMTCLSVSRDSKSMLVNMEHDEIHLIEIETARLLNRYEGQHQSEFIIRSVFGGLDEGLVISGSANSMVHIWHRETGQLIECFKVHDHGCANAVSWNPTHPGMFVSGGDDGMIYIFTAPPDDLVQLQKQAGPALPLADQHQRNYEQSLAKLPMVTYSRK